MSPSLMRPALSRTPLVFILHLLFRVPVSGYFIPLLLALVAKVAKMITLVFMAKCWIKVFDLD